jgi:hypothetical protein
MDEKSTGLNPELEVIRLRSEIDVTRHDLETYIAELDRRRHQALDLKLQLRKRPGVAVGVGVAIVTAVAGTVAMLVRTRRQKGQGHRAPSRIAPPPLLARVESSRILKFFVTSAVPIGIGVARRLLETRRSSRIA